MYVHLFTVACTTVDWCDVAMVTIDMLPDVALLEIFDFYANTWSGWKEWHTLVHVCQKWRNIVFESPLRLHLQLYCNAGTPVRETLNVWPPLPIIVSGTDHEKWGVDNIVAALQHKDRICGLYLHNISGSELEGVVAAMQQPFPALTGLNLQYKFIEQPPVFPASFLGGSAQALESLRVVRIAFRGLPNLLLSATRLVSLELWDIPHSGYFSPESMVTSLSVLTKLESLQFGFESPQSRPDRKNRRPHPQTLILLPVLTLLMLKGVGDYVEDLVAGIDAPLLDNLTISLLHQEILETPQITQFISRTPKIKAYDEVHMVFSDREVSVRTFGEKLSLGILCAESDVQLSSLQQLCSSFIPQALVERVYILEEDFFEPLWQDDVESSQWLDLLEPFTNVKGLYISPEFAPRIAPALQELVMEGVTEVLPALQTLFLMEPPLSELVPEGIGQFVVARQLSSLPITVSRWE